jgi:hypothetical protein|tara:strand:+ start:10430 stop:12235 length:1806 start_codon:yes stop_codon:yes gene_type:complete
MSNFLNSGKVGNIGLNHMKAIRENTISKWDSLGFLDGLKGHVKENIAQLYENEASHLLNESTDASSSGSFETVVFPIVRRVFSKLLANDIVSVQAMNMPIGKLFFFVPQTSSRYDSASDTYGNSNVDPKFSAHTSMGADGLPLVKGATSGYAPTQYLSKNLYDIYYNDGLFDASKGEISIIAGTGNLVTMGTNGEFSAAATFAALPTATDGSLRNAILQVSGFSAINKGRLSGPDGNPMDTESFMASLKIVNNSGEALVDADGYAVIAVGAEVPFRLVTQKYGKGIVAYDDICDDAGVIYLEADLTHPVDAAGTSTYDGYTGIVSGASTVLSGLVATDLSVSWAEYASLELETEMGEVSFKLDEVVVSVEERKLRATWSPELAQDVSAFHNIDAEAELTAMLSEQVAAEIDREILRDLRKAAAWQLRWDWNGWRKASLAANAYTQKDWNQTLITKVNQISAQIHKSTLRGGANFVVVSSEISAVFDDLEYFHVSDASPEQDQYNMGIEKIGALSGRYQVYRDPYAPSWSLIMGHKGKSLLDTGYIYAPYVPMQLTPTMYNPFNFAPVKGIMTRYAKKVVNNRFYGAIRVDGLQTFNVNELR